MSSVVSGSLLSKDPEPDGKKRLYKVKFFNDLEMFLVGTSLYEALYSARIGFKYRKKMGQYSECTGYKISRFYIVPTWKDLLSKQDVIKSYTDNYKRQIIELTDFMAFFDEYSKEYYIVNKQTRQAITIK